MEYEICYLIGESKEADLDKIRKDVEKVIEKHKGLLIEGEFVKKRRLAYEIKNEARGTYVAKRFNLPTKDEREEKYPEKDFVVEMTKDLNFNQDVLRFIIVKADELVSFEELENLEEDNKREKEGFKKSNRVVKEVSKKEEKIISPKEEDITPKEEKVEEALKEEIPAEEKIKEKAEEEIKEEKSDKKEGKEDKNDISEDNIDEKLDEILNI